MSEQDAPEAHAAASPPASAPAAKREAASPPSPKHNRNAAVKDDAAPPSPATPTFPPPVAGGLAWLRECTTTALAACVAVVTLVLLWETFHATKDFKEQKDVMLYGFALLGTVTGYYFGRVPAERRAETADQKAQEAQHTAHSAVTASAKADEAARQAKQENEDKSKKLAEAKAGIERAKAALVRAAPPHRAVPRQNVRLSLDPSADLLRTVDLHEGKDPAPEGPPPAEAPATDPVTEGYMELEVLSRLL